ncbi:MAG: cytochrome c [Gemmatimonadetes bacterium]|nr:cytochrome c [Gemmatimonadota bacterium]
MLIQEQRLRGEGLYREHCYSCHEVEGAIGVELSARVLASYDFAGPLYDYLDFAMPYNEPGSLAPTQYWDIMAYLLIDRELARLEAPLSARTSDRLRLADGGR